MTADFSLSFKHSVLDKLYIVIIFVHVYISNSCAASVLIVDLVRLAPDNHRGGMQITLSAILAINSEIKDWLVPFVAELIDIRRRRK